MGAFDFRFGARVSKNNISHHNRETNCFWWNFWKDWFPKKKKKSFFWGTAQGDGSVMDVLCVIAPLTVHATDDGTKT